MTSLPLSQKVRPAQVCLTCWHPQRFLRKKQTDKSWLTVTGVATGGIVGANLLPVLGFGTAGVKAGMWSEQSDKVVFRCFHSRYDRCGNSVSCLWCCCTCRKLVRCCHQLGRHWRNGHTCRPCRCCGRGFTLLCLQSWLRREQIEMLFLKDTSEEIPALPFMEKLQYFAL